MDHSARGSLGRSLLTTIVPAVPAPRTTSLLIACSLAEGVRLGLVAVRRPARPRGVRRARGGRRESPPTRSGRDPGARRQRGREPPVSRRPPPTGPSAPRRGRSTVRRRSGGAGRTAAARPCRQSPRGRSAAAQSSAARRTRGATVRSLRRPRRCPRWRRCRRPGRRRFGLRRHYRVAPWTDLVEVHWARSAEAYVTPVAPDLVGVALLGPTRSAQAAHH